jgi:catechol 2,3-dioxygenase-like lactoylglutathione lyase family enzyme
MSGSGWSITESPLTYDQGCGVIFDRTAVPMVKGSDLVAFVATTDLAKAREFYEEVLSLRLVEANDYAAVFDANGTMLRVTAVPDRAAAAYTVLGWRVTGIEGVITELSGKGIAFTRYEGLEQDDAGIWTTPNGDQVAWFTDPDGNVLSLTQFN